jgi:hypothetical protein
MVMLVCIETSNRILLLEALLLKHLQYQQLIRDLVVAYYEALIHAHWLVKLKPHMRSDVRYLVPLLRVSV